MKKKWTQGIKLFLALFTILFLGRWAWLYQMSRKATTEVPVPVYQPAVLTPEPPPPPDGDDEDGQAAADYNFTTVLSQNYASGPTVPGPGSPAGVQTYEKAALLASRTRDFDASGRKVKAAVGTAQAQIQQEEITGLRGSRLWSLTLGVVPNRFDILVDALKVSGELVSFQVIQTDRTQDGKNLIRQRSALERQKAELEALKHKGGKMTDLLKLQERIFNLGKEIEDLGIRIGQFEGATGLCTVMLTLKEIGMGPSLLVLALRSFDWTVQRSFSMLLWVLLVSLGWLFLLWLVGKAEPVRGRSLFSLKKDKRKP